MTTAATRRLYAQSAALKRWAVVIDKTAATEALRAGRDEMFRRQVLAAADAQGVTLADTEVEQRVIALRRAHMLKMAAKSAEVRAQKKAEAEAS